MLSEVVVETSEITQNLKQIFLMNLSDKGLIRMYVDRTENLHMVQ